MPCLIRRFAGSLNGAIVEGDENLQLFAGLTNEPFNEIRIRLELICMTIDSMLEISASERVN